MCSDRPRPAAALSLVATLTLALGFALAGCGKQGDPMPRPRAIPRAATDLALSLRGAEALLAFSYPSSTLSGLPLPGLAAVVVFEVARELPPTTTKLVISPAEFETLARPVVTLEGAALNAAIAGDRIRVRIPLAPEAFTDGKARAWAVRTEAVRGEPSPWSNIVSGLPRPALAAPEGLEATAAKGGVELAWKTVAGATGYAVLRREATDPEWSAPLATAAADATSHLDRSAVYGTRYVYTVLALAGGDPPTESAPRYEREVDYRDVFPPAPPRGLRGIALAAEVRLVWEASPDADLAGYHVERSAAGAAFERLTAQPVDALEYSDRGAPEGRALVYRIIAVDRAGNESPPSAPVEVRRP